MNESEKKLEIEVTDEMIEAGALQFQKWLEVESHDDWYNFPPEPETLKVLLIKVYSSMCGSGPKSFIN